MKTPKKAAFASDNQNLLPFKHDGILQPTCIYFEKWNFRQITVTMERVHLQIGVEGFDSICNHLLLPQWNVQIHVT